MAAAIALVLIAGIVVAIVAPGTYSIGSKALTARVLSALRAREVTAAITLRCNPAHHVRKGSTTGCKAADPVGDTQPLTVHWSDDHGHFTLTYGTEKLANAALFRSVELAVRDAVIAEETYATDYNGAYTDNLSTLALAASPGVTVSVTLETGIDYPTFCVQGSSALYVFHAGDVTEYNVAPGPCPKP